MNELEQFTAMLTRAGIVFRINDGIRGSDDRIVFGDHAPVVPIDPGTSITIQVGELLNNRKVYGYSGFATNFDFNPDGALERIAVWE